MDQDVRWKQRYLNYTKALGQLTEFIQHGNLNKFELQGLIQCFEYTFELAWKTMKDYLELEGFSVKTPRETIQTAFQAELIHDGHVWIDALNKRNLMAHTYTEDAANEAVQLIFNAYYRALVDLADTLEKKL